MSENETINHAAESVLPAEMSGGALAYLGDAVLEVLVRRMLVSTGIANAGRLSRMSLDYVRATAQSAGLEALLPLLTEEESAVYRRGRNAAGAHPKSAGVGEYRRATGLEALFGYLYVQGNTARLEELFAVYCRDRQGQTTNEENPVPQEQEKEC
ncbi:MAG: Mini-ribonuclease 3 [Eubacteriales bacterium]